MVSRMRTLLCVAPVNVRDKTHKTLKPRRLLKKVKAIEGPFAPLGKKTHFIVGQDIDTVREFVREVLPNPSGTTSYTGISSSSCCLHGLESAIDYGAGTIDATTQMELVPNSMLVLGVCIKNALEDIVMRRCDKSIDKLGDWIRKVSRPVFLRIGYEFDGAWNNYDPELYKLAFKWIVSRLRFKGVHNFVSVWQSATHYTPIENGRPKIDRSFMNWWPGTDVVDWMGTSYFNFDRRIHDAFLNFARSKGKPVMIAEASPQGYDLELGMTLDVFTNRRLSVELTGKEIWIRWFKPFFRYINDNRDVIRAVAYINTSWKTQQMWNTGENGFWGDSRIQADAYIKEKFVKELSNESHWLLSSPEFMSKIHIRP